MCIQWADHIPASTPYQDPAFVWLGMRGYNPASLRLPGRNLTDFIYPVSTMRKIILCLLLSLSLTTPASAAQNGQPADVVDAYIDAMRQHDASPDLDIYSAATKDMLRNWHVNNAQMDNVVRDHKTCSAPDSYANQAGTHAVVRYGVDERLCNPYFLVMEDGAWRLDLTMMQSGIRFNNKNQWHFVMSAKHPYWFAFADWRIDDNGFPHPAW